MSKVTFLTEPGKFDLLLVSLPNAASILGRDSGLPVENLAIARLAADAARYGLTVGICDGDEIQLSLSELTRLILKCKCSLIAASSYQSNIVDTLSLLRKFKKKNPSTTTCLGGYQVTFHANELLQKETYIDTVVVGRGESILPRLVLAAKRNDNPKGDFSKMRDRGLPILSGVDASDAVDPEIKWMARHWPAVQSRRAASMITSDGCISKCSFCATPEFEKLTGGDFPWHARTVDDVIEEIELLKLKGDVRHLHFHDPDFLGLTSAAWHRSEEIARRLKELNFGGTIRFTAQARAVATLPDDFWRLWKSVGLERVFIGLESGDEATLRDYRKSSRIQHNLNSVAKLRDAGISLQAGFIMFTPDSTPEEIVENINFLNEVDQAHFSRGFVNSLHVYPGTKCFSHYYERGLLSFDEPYLPIRVRYVNPSVGSLVNELKPVATTSFPLDRFLRDLDFGISAGYHEILTEFGWITNCEHIERLYDEIKVQRAHNWTRTIAKCVTVQKDIIPSLIEELTSKEDELWQLAKRSVNPFSNTSSHKTARIGGIK